MRHKIVWEHGQEGYGRVDTGASTIEVEFLGATRLVFDDDFAQARSIQHHLYAAKVDGQLDFGCRIYTRTHLAVDGQAGGEVLCPVLKLGLECSDLTLCLRQSVVLGCRVQVGSNL